MKIAGRPSGLTYNAARGHTEAQVVQQSAIPIAFAHVSDVYDSAAKSRPDRDRDAVQLGHPRELCSLWGRREEIKSKLITAHRI